MPTGATPKEGTHRVGVDLVHVTRASDLLENPDALARMFRPGELARHDSAYVAGRMAAKEAAWKALGEAPPRWLEVEIREGAGGKPGLQFVGDLAGRVASADLSVAHDGEYAVAVVHLTLSA